MVGRSRAPGHKPQPGVVHAETRLRGIPTCHSQDKHKVKPEFSTLYRPINILDHMQQAGAGSPAAGRTVGQDRRLRTASLDPHTLYATDRINDIRGSPSCTGVGVVKLGRGVSVIGVSRPRPISIRASPPDSGVVPFSSRNPPGAKSERQRIPPVVSCSPLGLVKANPGPYVSGTMGTSDRNNHAYGISCRTRPIPIVSTRSDYLGTGTAWAVQSAQNK